MTESTKTFTKKYLVMNKDHELSKLQAAWRKEGGSASNTPEGRDVWNARYLIKKKYGVAMDDLPRNPDGRPNISAMIRLLLKQTPGLSAARCKYYLETDGVTYHPTLFDNVARELREKERQSQETQVTEEEPEELDSPDPNQKSGPRARYQVTQPSLPDHREKIGAYTRLEEELDRLLFEAMKAEDDEVVQSLREVRRKITRKLVQISVA